MPRYNYFFSFLALAPLRFLRTSPFLACLSRSPDCYHGFSGSPHDRNIFFISLLASFVILFASPFINCFLQFILSRSGPALLKLRVPFVSNFTAPPMRRTSFLRRPLSFSTVYLIFLIWSRCHLATFSPFIFFQVAAYTAVNRRPLSPRSAPSPRPESVTSFHPSSPPFARVLSFPALFLHIPSCCPHVLSPSTLRRYYSSFYSSASRVHRFIPYILLVLFGHMSICCIMSRERVYKYKKVLQAEVAAMREHWAFKIEPSVAFKVVFVIHRIFLEQTSLFTANNCHVIKMMHYASFYFIQRKYTLLRQSGRESGYIDLFQTFYYDFT